MKFLKKLGPVRAACMAQVWGMGLSATLPALVSTGAWAQASAAAVEEKTLAPVVVTGNPLGSNELIAPTEQLGDAELRQRSQSTLGETLNGLPGVSSTYFGPNASRPVIRGLDGDRIAVLNNGGPSTDLSSLSYDHAMTMDPLLIERVEVLRGPGVLEYGGSAVGGVVNVIDGRIQREALFDEKGGVTGKVDAGYATGNKEQSGAVVLDGGTNRYNLHVDAMSRRTDDVSVPKDLSCTKGGVTTTSRTLCNSASDTQSGAVGGSVFFDRGYLGASLSTYESNYGTVAEDEVTIKMRSNKLALEGELRDLQGPFQSVKAQYGQTDYQHTEFEAGVAGTVFNTRGQNLRVQARQVRWGPLDGVMGLQFDDSDFSATGTEAYAPSSKTLQRAAYAHEEIATSWGKLSAGARVESVKVDSYGVAGEARFVPGSRSFTPTSYALGSLWNVATEWQMTANLSANERAPKHYELYANGEHVATNVEEIGNANLDVERSVNVDWGLAWKRGAHNARVQLFQHQFSNYISLEGTDLSASPPQYTYTQVQARFVGFEAAGTARLMQGHDTVDWNWRADQVQADNTSTGQPLPRIAPYRVGSTLRWGRGAWNTRVGVDYYGAQNRVPDGQLATGGYTLWSAGLSLNSKLGGYSALWYARLDNATDTLAYSASSILTQTVPGKVPLPGRSLKLGLQLQF
jgi:iron complex outermembrane recepter protein